MLRGRPGHPELGIVLVRMLTCRAQAAANRSGVSSVDPSSTNTTSNSLGGRLCAARDSIRPSMRSPGLYTGTTTLTLTSLPALIRCAFPSALGTLVSPCASISSTRRRAAPPSSRGLNRSMKASYRAPNSSVTVCSDCSAAYSSFSVVTIGPGSSRS